MIKKPLVLTDGEIEQLQSGDVLASQPNSMSLTNGDSVTLPAGAPVYVESADTMERATANDYPNVIGVVIESTVVSASGVVQTDGVVTLLTTEWDSVTGNTGGLTPGATYYLGATQGISTVAVTAGSLTRVGIAINTTDLDLKISRPILL